MPSPDSRSFRDHNPYSFLSHGALMLRKWMMSCLLASALVPPAAQASEAKVRQAVQGKFPSMTIESVTRTPYLGLFEIVLDGEIVYTDEKAEYLLSGNVFDIRGTPPRNLTQETMARIVSRALAGAHDLAIKRVRGNGKRVVYTFEDPNCGYCKEFTKELLKVNNLTVYTFLLPILSPDSAEKSRAVWCAKDRLKAWDDLMLKGATPEGGRTCDTPLEKNQKMARRFGVRGTPAVYLGNGQQIGGYLPADKLEQALASGGQK